MAQKQPTAAECELALKDDFRAAVTNPASYEHYKRRIENAINLTRQRALGLPTPSNLQKSPAQGTAGPTKEPNKEVATALEQLVQAMPDKYGKMTSTIPADGASKKGKKRV